MERSSSSSTPRVLFRHPQPSTTATSAAAAATAPLQHYTSSTNTSQNPNCATTSTTSTSSSSSSSSADSSLPKGVVVVGFIGSRSSTDVSNLINRILDANVFGSGNLDKDFFSALNLEARAHGKGEEDWFPRRRISYFHEPEKGMLFLQFSPSWPPELDLLSLSTWDGQDGGGASVVEECQTDDLRVMLLMFSVCHVIVFVHEGLRFDVQILKKFRMLQASKHALIPYVRSQVFTSKQSASVTQPSFLRPSSISSPSRRGGSSSRHGSAISLMSGSCYPSMLPGQCIPVVLFVFQDDISDVSNPVTNTDDAMDSSRQNLTLKGSGSVLMLARPASKAEGSFRKRLQSSLEGQIRFLIKKCRILAGTDHSHFGSRGVGKVNSLPLFSLDASRVVTLLNRSMNQRGEALSYVTSLIEEALNSKAKADMPMLENYCQNLHNDDVQAINDFISRQADMLRGRGGSLGNANSGSVAGVGMVAAAAAAAAVSAASATPSKPVNAPELPSMENWYASTYQLLKALLHIGHGFRDDRGNIKVIPLEPTLLDTRDKHALENAISCLENSKGMNMKFSASWCQRVLPIAKDVYLKDLPACYPTSMHNSHLENALLNFCSMVKGPAVKLFAKKLADDCKSIWEAGRQLCDAISLTGKPCMHHRHDAMTEDTTNQHSSGNVFLHACACGRSRHMRDDPFDFQTANVTFNHFIGCENTLPTLSLPHLSNNGPLPPASWSLLRIGGARYYEPSKGLLQPGFCLTQKFLMKWMIAIEKEANGVPVGVTKNNSIVCLVPQSNTKSDVDEITTKSNDDSVVQHILESREKQPELVASSATSINFGKGLPSFTLKKPFVEVVASTIVADLRPQQRKQTKHVKGLRMSSATNQINDKSLTIENQHASKQGEPVVSRQCSTIPKSDSHVDGNPYLQIGTNIVPVNIFSSQEIKTSSLRKSIVYVGFEHECSYGHRFLLSPDHLKGLDPSYPLTSKPYPSSESSKGKHPESKVKAHERVDCYSSSRRVEISTGAKKDNVLNKSTEAGCVQGDESLTFVSRVGIDKLQSVHGLMLSESVHQLERKISHVKLDDTNSAYSMLASNLPVYMNCPYCNSSAKQAKHNGKFASKVSQLQRIFLVTPPFPTVLATCPVIQFEQSCLPESTPNLEQQSRFSLGCLVTLPPESFITIRLPFIYGVRMNEGLLRPLDHLVHKPELTAWLIKGTALQVVSMGSESDEEFRSL